MRGGEAGLVAKHADRARLPPRFGEAVQGALQRWRKRAIGGMAVAYEGVVAHDGMFPSGASYRKWSGFTAGYRSCRSPNRGPPAIARRHRAGPLKIRLTT